jgi:PAS domain S-box-containing protein
MKGSNDKLANTMPVSPRSMKPERASSGPRVRQLGPRGKPSEKKPAVKPAAPRLSPWAGLLFVLLCPIPAWTAQQYRPSLPLLTRIEQVRNLTASEAQRGYPVDLRAVVTYFDPGPPNLFVQDSSAGIWVDLGESTRLSLKVGQLVRIQGVSAELDFAPQVANPRITVLGEAPLPRARPTSFDRMASSAEDSQWVEVEGIVHSAVASDSYLRLGIAVNGGRLLATVPDFQSSVPEGLVDAKVRVHGACGAIFNQKNQLTGIVLHVPSLSQVTIEEQPSPDPFSLPVQPADSLLRFTPKGASGHRVRVQGVVTFSAPGTRLFIKDETQGLLVETSQTASLHPGDLVDVAGFPSSGEYTPMLVDAVFRKLRPGMEPAATTVTGEQAMQGAYDADLIRIEGRLEDQVQGHGKTDLVVQSGNVIFEARIVDSEGGTKWPHLAPGSRLQLTGICLIKVDDDRVPRAFRLLLRSPKDIIVLERPPWWTLSRTLWSLAIMGGAILSVMGWVFVLRRRVAEQTGIILQRLQREVALEERYRDLFENATDIVYTHDLEGNMTSLNRAGERSTGYSRDEVLKMNIDQLLAPESCDIAHGMIRRKISTGKPTTYEIAVIAKDGHRVQLEVSTRLVHRHGKPFAVQGNGRDIAERKRVEEELRWAKEAAEAASRAKSEFLANVSHEIRTPMNGILGMTELALETSLTSEQREYLEMVKTSGNSLLQVLGDILDFSKVEAQELELEAVPFSLRENLEAALKPLAGRAHQSGLEFTWHLPSQAPDTVIGDPERLSQIVLQLGSNAIKFTQHGGVTVRADTESEADGQVCLHFAVTDTGIGIPADKQQLIFEAFVQADGSTTRRYGGSGLGLAICAQLVERMGGRIWVESEPDKGSTFHFTARFGLAVAADQPPSTPCTDLAGVGTKPQKTEVITMSTRQASFEERPITDTMASGAAALDRVATLAGVEGDSSLLAELATLFVDDYPRMLSSIREALDHQDPEALAVAAHAVKGSVANFAAPMAFDAALKLETMGRCGDLTRAHEACAALERALEQLAEALLGLAKEVTL